MQDIKDQNIKDFAEYMHSLGGDQVRAQDQVEAVTLHGKHYIRTGKSLTEVYPDGVKVADALCIATLDGLLDYIVTDPEERLNHHIGVPYVLHIENEMTANLKTAPLLNTSGSIKRPSVAFTGYSAQDFPWGRFMPAEDFIILLSTRFAQSENLDVVLRVAGALRSVDEKSVADDGISQRVNVKTGIEKVDAATFVNPVPLRPLRIFPELEQPESPFTIRFKQDDGKSPLCAIFEADAGAWKHKAVQTIAAHCIARLTTAGLENVTVIA